VVSRAAAAAAASGLVSGLAAASGCDLLPAARVGICRGFVLLLLVGEVVELGVPARTGAGTRVVLTLLELEFKLLVVLPVRLLGSDWISEAAARLDRGASSMVFERAEGVARVG
jgi:hypothetical protein